ncbi:hypothetical protein EVAR_60363_1 [Eumeta japonica]|uniref:Uncharacterized protein n=1 Tax=Eumeta variegata TaxID=151549 RepID=A0A4C1Z8K4_EUMVA|nr:hypothetical protein EVAR_60363_1 [Eumeta japonica]
MINNVIKHDPNFGPVLGYISEEPSSYTENDLSFALNPDSDPARYSDPKLNLNFFKAVVTNNKSLPCRICRYTINTTTVSHTSQMWSHLCPIHTSPRAPNVYCGVACIDRVKSVSKPFTALDSGDCVPGRRQDDVINLVLMAAKCVRSPARDIRRTHLCACRRRSTAFN